MPNRRTILLGLASMTIILSAAGAARAAAPAPAILTTSAGDLVIRPVAHASLALISGAHVLYLDPAKEDFSGLPAPTTILFTHAHGDHFDPEALGRMSGSAKIVVTEEVFGKLPEALKARASVMKNGDKGDVDGIPVTAVPAYNTTADRLKYHPKGVGNGYVLSFGDTQVYVAGDTEDTPEMRALTGIDVAFP